MTQKGSVWIIVLSLMKVTPPTLLVLFVNSIFVIHKKANFIVP